MGLGGPFLQSRGRDRQRRHEKHDLYYCGLLLLFGGGKGRHFYEEGIDGRADGPKNRQREYEDERTVIEKSLKHPTRNSQLIYLDIKMILSI